MNDLTEIQKRALSIEEDFCPQSWYRNNLSKQTLPRNLKYDDDIIDWIIGYRSIKEIEESRNSKTICSAVGDAKWSESIATGYNSSYSDIKAVLKVAGIKDGETFIDIGSGYGRIGKMVV